MKILHAAETVRGGVATVLNALLAAQIAAFGMENICCVVPEDQSADISEAPKACLKTFERSGRNVRSLLSFAKVFLTAVCQQRPDVVHLHSSLAGFVGRLGLLALWPWRRPKVVYCPHAWSFTMEIAPWKKWVYAHLEKALLPLTSVVICISRFERQSGLKWGMNPCKLQVIYNGVAEAQESDKNPFTKPGLRLLFVGRFDRQKGFDILTAAMQKLEGEDIHLVAVGAPVHAEETPPVRANITYTGWLRPAQVQAYYQHAHVLVVPSRWEGFGLVAAEAMAHGTPVLASQVGSLPELVEEGVTGKVFALNATALANILCATPLKEWQVMRATARQAYVARFTEARMCQDVAQLYLTLFGKSGPNKKILRA